MKKKFSAILTVLLITMLAASTVYAGGVRITASTELKSLFAKITATGLGSTNYVFDLDASGIASVVCTNYGGNQAPGQNYPHVDGKDSKDLPSSKISKNGKAIFDMHAVPLEETPGYVLPWDVGGCPNSNWSAKVDFVYWQSMTITAYIDLGGGVRGAKVAENKYQCVTTRTGPRGDPASTFDDGTVSCTQIN